MWIYNTFIYDPIFNTLIWLYDTIPGNDIGIAIIILTLIIRFILWPLTNKSLQSQKALQEIQPKVKEIQQKYKDQKEQQAQEMMKLYKREKVSPFSSCLPLLIQLPIIFAVYQVFRQGLASENLDHLYSFVSDPGTINTISLGFIDLAQTSIVLAILAGIAQYWQTKMMMANKPPKIGGKEIEGAQDEKMMAAMNKNMTYIMPAITVIFGATLPAGLTLYWFISTLFMGIQQVIIFHKNKGEQLTVNN